MQRENDRIHKEDDMRDTAKASMMEHIYKNIEITAGTIDTPPAAESTFPSTVHSSLDNASSDQDVMTTERERMLEQFMQDIKSFIRGIDVNTL